MFGGGGKLNTVWPRGTSPEGDHGPVIYGSRQWPLESIRFFELLFPAPKPKAEKYECSRKLLSLHIRNNLNKNRKEKKTPEEFENGSFALKTINNNNNNKNFIEISSENLYTNLHTFHYNNKNNDNNNNNNNNNKIIITDNNNNNNK